MNVGLYVCIEKKKVNGKLVDLLLDGCEIFNLFFALRRENFNFRKMEDEQNFQYLEFFCNFDQNSEFVWLTWPIYFSTNLKLMDALKNYEIYKMYTFDFDILNNTTYNTMQNFIRRRTDSPFYCIKYL